MRILSSMHGLNNTSYLPKCLVLIMSIVSLNVYADTDNETDLPSMERLQFLSDWETDDGQ